MANQKEIISTINDLIETLKDGQKGFKEAADAVNDPQLKSLFTGYSQQRARFASELQAQARSEGETRAGNRWERRRGNAPRLDQLEIRYHQPRRERNPCRV